MEHFHPISRKPIPVADISVIKENTIKKPTIINKSYKYIQFRVTNRALYGAEAINKSGSEIDTIESGGGNEL